MPHAFTAVPVAKGPKGAWTHLVVPFNVEQVFGSKAMVKVAGTINGIAFRNSLMPIGDGTHYMNIRKELKAAASIQPGTPAKVVLDLDQAERTVAVPEDLLKAFESNPQAAAYFNTLAYSHQKEYSDWITSAKKPETRTSRIAKAIEMLNTKQRRNR